mgnify:FL=1
MVVLSVFSPHKYKLSTYKKYNIKILEQSFIGLFLLKSRFGTSDIMIPMNFLGDISHYIEMPKPEEIYDWERYTNPNYLLRNKEELKEEQLNDKDEIDNIDNIKQNSKFTFVL